MVKPNFLIVGAEKSATTWLHECLNEHPEVYVPDIKELHYFCPDDCRLSKQRNGLDWYLAHFNPTEGQTAIGETTPCYMVYPDVAERIHALNQSMKIIFSLRNPIERAYSAYWMRKSKFPDMPSFSEYIDSKHHYVTKGLYYRQVQCFRKRFGEERMSVLFYDDIEADPRSLIKNLYSFLEVQKDFSPRALNEVIAPTRKMNRFNTFLFHQYGAKILNKGVAREAWRFLKYTMGLKTVLKSKTYQQQYPPMQPEDRARLIELYRDEVEKLFALAGREFPNWLA